MPSESVLESRGGNIPCEALIPSVDGEPIIQLHAVV
jgi:hypothetical protein